MNAIGKSSVVFVTLSGLFWGGWVLGSQTPEGQEALARAYQAYSAQQAEANQDLFSTTALRAIVCGQSNAVSTDQKPCVAIVAAGRMFIVDAGSGAAASLTSHGISTQNLQAVLLTSAGLTQTADLDELYGDGQRASRLLPVYGPAETQRLVDGLNQAAGFDGVQRGLQAWGPSPEPGRAVIVYEADGLVISAFTTQEDAFTGRVGYRFDYRGRSLVVGGDGRIADAPAAANADVVLEGARSEQLGQLHQSDMATAAQVAASAQAANAKMLVLTGAHDEVAAQMQGAQDSAKRYEEVRAGGDGMVLELPLENSEVNVRAL